MNKTDLLYIFDAIGGTWVAGIGALLLFSPAEHRTSAMMLVGSSLLVIGVLLVASDYIAKLRAVHFLQFALRLFAGFTFAACFAAAIFLGPIRRVIS